MALLVAMSIERRNEYGKTLRERLLVIWSPGIVLP